MKNNNSDRNKSIQELIPPLKSRGVNLGLKRIESVIEAMGNPCKNIPAIQIAGTNGKGSIACFLESCLIKAGIRTGCTTSPHLVDWCERIRVDGKAISNEKFIESITTVKAISQAENLTPFELVIAGAFNHFYLNKVKLMILEVGLGGRLDATTSHPLRPFIGISGIGLDHCEYLGQSLKEITKEKAAIISKGSLVISSIQESDVKEVIEEIVLQKEAKIKWVSPLSKSWNLGLAGEIQRENAAVAKAILESLIDLGWEVNNQDIKEGLASAKWPGRLQLKRWEGKPILLDGAHNPHAIKQLSKERLNWSNSNKTVHWIIGIQIQKDAPKMLRNLLKEIDMAWIVPVPNHQSWTKKELCKTCPELSAQLREATGVREALEVLKSKNKWPIPAPVITGSLYLIGDLIASLKD